MASRTNRTRTSPTASKWRLLSLSKQQSKPESAWAVSIDIRDAYLHIPMCPTVWRYLQFCINKCLPFHVSTNRTGNLSTWVHQTSEAGSASVTSARCLSTCLPGRLAHLGGFNRDVEFPTGHMSVAPSGMDPKLSKVGTHTYSGFWVHQDALPDPEIHCGVHEWTQRPYQLLSAPYHCCLYIQTQAARWKAAAP